MGAVIQIFGLLAITTGVAMLVLAFLGALCAIGAAAIGIGATLWLVGYAFEQADYEVAE